MQRAAPKALVASAADAVLQKHYEPRGTQGSFVSAVLGADPKIRPKAAQDYWRLRRLQARSVVPKRGRKQQKKQRLAGLDDEQRAALEDLFMRQFRMSIGVRALWEAFNETNERQQQALEDSAGKKAWISWRDMRAWYNAQENNQLMRNAKPKSKTAARIPTRAMLVPFARMQLDSIVMKKPGTAATEGLADQGKNAIIDLVCTFTRFTMLGAVRNLNAAETARVVIEMIQSIRDMPAPTASP